MAQVLFDDLLACDDCTIAIANDDYTGMDDATKAQVKAGLERWSREGWLVVGDEHGFSSQGCDICNRGWAGNKHSVTVLSV